MLQNTIKKISVFAFAIISAASAVAQTYRVPNAHKSEHLDLIARQENIGNQISSKDTQAFLDNLFKDEAEPELDIYTEGWESKRVNAYTGMTVPDTKVMTASDVNTYALLNNNAIVLTESGLEVINNL